MKEENKNDGAAAAADIEANAAWPLKVDAIRLSVT